MRGEDQEQGVQDSMWGEDPEQGVQDRVWGEDPEQGLQALAPASLPTDPFLHKVAYLTAHMPHSSLTRARSWRLVRASVQTGTVMPSSHYQVHFCLPLSIQAVWGIEFEVGKDLGL